MLPSHMDGDTGRPLWRSQTAACGTAAGSTHQMILRRTSNGGGHQRSVVRASGLRVHVGSELVRCTEVGGRTGGVVTV